MLPAPADAALDVEVLPHARAQGTNVHPEYTPETRIAQLGSILAMEPDLLELLGERIRDLRTAKGLSQEKLAADADISTDYVGDIEHGRYKVTVPVLVQIAKALGTEGWVILQYAERKAHE